MTGQTASLAMYSLAELRPHYQRLWTAVVLTDLPATLVWPDDVHATWTDNTVVLKQVCGWPLITQLADTVKVIGAFEHDVDGADGHRYRSSVVAISRGRPDDVASWRAAYNTDDSLSGWVSLLSWSGRSGTSLRRGAVQTGSHVASLEALRSGRAEFASIDAVTLAHVRRHRPELVAGLDVVGTGPLVPTLPLVVPASADDGLVHGLRESFSSVVADPSFTSTCDELLITGFAALDVEDYRRDLARLRAA